MKKLCIVLTFLVASSVQATNFDQANWYLSADIAKIKDRFMPHLVKNKAADKSLKFSALFPDTLTQITLYGQTNQDDDVTAVIRGQFNQFSVSDYIAKLNFLADAGDELNVDSSLDYKGTTIEHIQSNEDDEVSIYASILNGQMMVVGFDLAEVKNWINGRYAESDVIPTGMLTLLVNADAAMAHMGADLSKNNGGFKSTVFQKINHLSASMTDQGSSLAVEAALGTRDEATAQQVQQVINGLVAMNDLSTQSDQSEAWMTMMQTLKVVKKGQNLILSTSIPFDVAIEAMLD